jgi:hypothetical protein
MSDVAVPHLQEGRMPIYSINCKMLGNYVNHLSPQPRAFIFDPPFVTSCHCLPHKLFNELVGCFKCVCFVRLYINNECLLA